MSYLRAYIRACEGYGWEGGPEFSTRIVRMANGRERRNAEWSQPQHFYAVPFANLVQSQYAPIKQMHLNRRGRWGCFLFRDRLDDYADDEAFAVAEAGQTEFQLAKWSVIDGVSYHNEINAIYLPNDDGSAQSNTIEITVDGNPAGSHVIDRDTGIVTFDAAPGDGAILRWTGGFSRWVRFDQDRLPFSIDNKSGGEFVVNGGVELLEQPPPEVEES